MKKMQLTAGMFGLVSLFLGSFANAATLSVNLSSPSVSVGDALTASVAGSDFTTGVSGASVVLTWDTSVLQLTSTLAEINQSGIDNGFTDSFVIGFNQLLPSGEAQITLATPFGATGITATAFDFFSVGFTTLVESAGTLLNLTEGLDGAPIDAFGDVYTGTSYVSASAAVTAVSAVPIPAAVWLLGSGLLGLVGVARRRSATATRPIASATPAMA